MKALRALRRVVYCMGALLVIVSHFLPEYMYTKWLINLTAQRKDIIAAFWIFLWE